VSPLRQALAGYLTVRRALGYKLARPEKLLGQFIGYLEAAGATTITVEHALAWATLPAGDVSWHASRMSAVRGFAAYLRTIDPSAEVPPADLIPWRPRRATPYLYSDDDITALIAAAARLRFPLRTATYQTLIGLLAVTGMRVGEAIRLDRPDADLDVGVLTIRQSKFGKSRAGQSMTFLCSAVHPQLCSETGTLAAGGAKSFGDLDPAIRHLPASPEHA
jgi:integrase/recombinase XerD